jgi:DNA polymerase III epsilon subunit family exonuclease
MRISVKPCCFDLETTGLDCENERIIEIGACIVKDGEVTETFGTFVDPEKEIPEKITEITGIDDKMVAGAPHEKEALRDFFRFVSGRILVAHNASFDMSAINVELKNWGINELPAKRFRCSMKMFKDVVGRIEHNYYDKYVCLEKCCEYFGLKANNNCYHNALFDAFMTARLVCKLYELIENDSRFKNFKKEIKYNPNSYKNFNYLNNNLINNKNKSKYIYLNNTKKFLNKKTQRDKNEEISYEKVLNEEKINRNKIINENINNNFHNEFFRNTDSTTSNESIDKNKSEENLKSTSEKEGFSEEIIDEIFSDL